MTLTNILQVELTKYFTLAVMTISEWWVSVGRLQKFLEIPEFSSPLQDKPTIKVDNEIAISLKNVSCLWDSNTTITNEDNHIEEGDLKMTALMDINLDLRMNELTFIVGSVGSGKSALLLSLAG